MNTSDYLPARTFDPGSTGILVSGRLQKTRAFLWAMFLFAVVLGFFFISAMGAGWLGLRGNWFYLPAGVAPLLACWIYALLVRCVERRQAWEIRVNLPILSEIPLGFLLGAAYITAMWLIVLGLKVYATHRGVWTGWFDDFLFASYISAVIEELAFRAVLLRLFARMWGARTAVVLSSIIFGLAHFSHGSELGIIGIILCAGPLLGLLYVITGRLWLSVGVHLGFDFMETSVLGVNNRHGFFVSTPHAGSAAWISGGTFGPDGAIPAMIFGVLVNVVLWRVAFGQRPATSVTTSSSDLPSPGTLSA